MRLNEMLKEFEGACPPHSRDLYQTISLRMSLIDEEYTEVTSELDQIFNDAFKDYAEEKEAEISTEAKKLLLKELCDLVYVAVGTAAAFNMDFDGAFEEVHKSNMSKFIDPTYREDGKLIKGPSYVKPDMSRFV